MTLAPLLLTLLCGPASAQTPPAPDAATPEAPAAPAAGPVTYTLNASQSWLYVVVYNDTSALASRLGHDHAIKATDFTGKVVWDPANAGACSVDITFPVTALTPDPAGMRAHEGLAAEGAVDASQLETIKNNFLGKGQLDANAFGTISYKSTKCAGTTGQVPVTGNLTIHGVSFPVTATLDVKADGSTFSAKGTFKANASNFGFKPFTNLAGALRNQDSMKFVVDVVGTKS